uniref:Uncharacterized protein n=1 Tax=Romanomermis culicivorax TaxID=13658 RepID=A0A915JYM9_ROMCU
MFQTIDRCITGICTSYSDLPSFLCQSADIKVEVTIIPDEKTAKMKLILVNNIPTFLCVIFKWTLKSNGSFLL